MAVKASIADQANGGLGNFPTTLGRAHLAVDRVVRQLSKVLRTNVSDGS
jgi:hypothetical protein